MCAVYANRQLFLSMILYIIIGIVFLNIGTIFTFLGQEQEVALLAKQFLWITYPFYFFEIFWFVFVENFAVCQDAPQYQMHSQVAGTLSHLVFVYCFCYQLEMGFVGICLATGLMQVVFGLTGLFLVKYSDHFRTYSDVRLLSLETISNLSPLLFQDLKSIGTQIWMFWNADSSVLLASYLG